jgi:hypothetical protein
MLLKRFHFLRGNQDQRLCGCNVAAMHFETTIVCQGNSVLHPQDLNAEYYGLSSKRTYDPGLEMQAHRRMEEAGNEATEQTKSHEST